MVATLSRNEFLDDYWSYEPGESAVWIAPTGGGKSHMMWQCADRALRQHPQLSLSAAMPKPSDETTDHWAEALGLKVSDTYPFRKHWWESEPPGYIHWPRHIKGDVDANYDHLTKEFKAMLNGEYWSGDKIVCVDDAYLIAATYHCNRECDTYLIAGRSNRSGLFGCLQQPKGTVSGGSPSGYWYSQPSHLFLGKDGVASNRERFGEIAMGIDPRLIDSIVTNLRTYKVGNSNVSEFLYLNRSGPYAAVISPF